MENYRLNDLNDLEIITPTECEGYPGYFYIPGYPEYGISREGKVIKVKAIDRERHLGKELKTKVFNNYHRIGLVKDGKQYSNALHRLVAKTFVGRPSRHLDKPLDELHVNHVDANKLNNHYTNLEWVTPAENVEHANKLGNIAKQVPVLVKNILTGEIQRIRNMEDCVKKFDIPATTLLNHLRSKNAGTVTKGWHVFKLDDGSEWKPIRPDRQVENAWYQVNKWVATNQKTNKVIISDSSYDLADILGVNQDRIINLERRNCPELQDWIIQTKYMFISKDEKNKKTEQLKEPRSVKATHIKSNDSKTYPSIIACAKDLGFRHGALSWVLSRSLTKCKNGYKFEFV